MRITISFLFALLLWGNSNAQNLPVPKDIGNNHPRCYGKGMTRDKAFATIQNLPWATEVLAKTKSRVDKYLRYCEGEPDWLLARLQMYWKTKSITPFIKGGVYDHAEGEAPVPTVKFPGTRDHTSGYRRPKLEKVLPYMDDPRGLYYLNKSTGALEWTSIASTARNLESVNREILKIARDAAFLYWYLGEETYAKLAFGVLDTYLTGLYYREAPIDLSHGHHQTLVGLTSFEVIQEHQIAEVTETYDFLHDFLVENHQGKIPIYSRALQKWGDQVLKNGVSFNNWNLFQALHVSRIALVLENDAAYKNGKGAQYYLDQIMNQTSIRQWSMNKLIDSGYDLETGIWFESPGYSLNVLRDFLHFAEFYDRNFDIDLVAELPVLRKAVIAAPQYLYPNGYWVGFGDGHYNKLNPQPFLYMVENAKKFGKQDDEVLFTRILKTFFDKEIYSGIFQGRSLKDLFAAEPLEVSETIEAGERADFTAPLFYAPNASWLVQRQLFDEPESGLMISQIGSLGNHQHSNGIAMELYGYGMPLACDMGHGNSYFSIEYKEYYTQFPAHNTVAVNGKSKYPEMKANHPFVLNASHPKSQEQVVIPGVTFSDVSFLEPETNSDQRRVMGILADANTGYYIDIFRSRQNHGNDIKHEYFYHNLGKKLELMDGAGRPLALQPTEKMAFGDGDLMAYDYMWNKQSVETDQNLTGRFSFDMDDQTVHMNLWVQGFENREIFSALSPKNSALRHGPLPEKYNELPVPTMIIRQNGEAWNRPFVAVYEPALNETSRIKSVGYFGAGVQVGIHVWNKSGKEDYILSNVSANPFVEGQIRLEGSYAVVSHKGEDLKMLLGHGQRLAYGNYQLSIPAGGSMALEIVDGKWWLSSSENGILTVAIDNKKTHYQLQDAHGKTYDGIIDKKTMTVEFILPAMEHDEVLFINPVGLKRH